MKGINIETKVNEANRIVVAIAKADGEEVAKAKARCRAEDAFNPALGQKLAKHRVLIKLLKRTIRREQNYIVQLNTLLQKSWAKKRKLKDELYAHENAIIRLLEDHFGKN